MNFIFLSVIVNVNCRLKLDALFLTNLNLFSAENCFENAYCNKKREISNDNSRWKWQRKINWINFDFSEAWLFTWCLFCTVWSLLSMAVFYCIARDKKSLFLIIHEFAITASTTVTKFMVEKFNSMHLLLAVLAWFWIRFYESNLVVINCRKLIEITAVPHEFLHGEGSFCKPRMRPNNFISLKCDTV